jgi:hypothetical protein
VSPDAHTPAERADAVLRAAEAAAAAAQAADAAAHAASIPEPPVAPEPPAVPEPPAALEPPVAPEPPAAPAPPAPEPPVPEPPVADDQAALAHEAGAPARLRAAAAELEAHVEQAHTQLGALEDALDRVDRLVDQAD